MFRKRNRQHIEVSLIQNGIDLSNPLGKALLQRLVECGHSERTVYLVQNGAPSYNAWLIYSADSGQQIASVRPVEWEDDSRVGWWYLKGWAKDAYWTDPKSSKAYSKHDLFGKLIIDV